MINEDILHIIENDQWMMRVLRTARDQHLPQWMIGAGFVRNKIWNYLSGNTQEGVDTADIDLVYFDPHGNDESADEELSLKLREQTGIPWEIVNEYYAHTWNNLPAYGSTRDAISQWPETVTAIGVYIDEHDTLQLFAPYGIDDLVNFIVRPSPQFDGGIKRVRERVEQKGWIKKWPQIVVVS